MGQMFSYVIGILVAGLIVFGLHFGLHVGSPAYARQVLADQIAENNLDELENILLNGRNEERVAAVAAIGQGDDQIDRRVLLLSIACTSRDDTVQSICMLSVRRMGEAAKPGVRKLLASSNKNDVRNATGVIRALGSKGDEFAPDLLKMLGEGDYKDRHAALYGMQDMSPDVLLPGLDGVIKELDAQNFNTQCQACFVLARMGSDASPATERLVQLLQEGNPSSRSRAAEALAAIGPVDGFDIAELIGVQLEADAHAEKVRGLDAIGTLGPDQKTKANVDRIQHLIDNRRLNCVAEASLAMYRVTGEKEDALAKLQELLRDRNTRIAALECLGAMGSDAGEAVPGMLEFLNDDNTLVCETAILALKNIGPTADAALPRLNKLLNHEDYLMSIAAQEAIDAISPKTTGK